MDDVQGSVEHGTWNAHIVTGHRFKKESPSIPIPLREPRTTNSYLSLHTTLTFTSKGVCAKLEKLGGSFKRAPATSEAPTKNVAPRAQPSASRLNHIPPLIYGPPHSSPLGPRGYFTNTYCEPTYARSTHTCELRTAPPNSQ